MSSAEPERSLVQIGLRPPPKRAYRAESEGTRERDPKPRGDSVILITRRISPSIRTAVGWLYPLEHYDETMRLSPAMQYAELLLIMGSNGRPDEDSVRAVLREARNRLDDKQYDRFLGYLDLLVAPRPIEVPDLD